MLSWVLFSFLHVGNDSIGEDGQRAATRTLGLL